MPGKTREQKIDALIAKQEISDLIVRYTYGCDRCDERLLASVYYEDAREDHGSFVGKAPDFAAWATDFHKKVVHTKHIVTNMLIEVDGNRATAQTYVLAFIRMRRETPWVATNQDGSLFDRTFGGRYLDHLEKRSGEWKIAERTLVVDWQRSDPFEETQVSISEQPFNAGQRNRNDLSYKYLTLE